MWPHHAPILSPLTDLTGRSFVWGAPQQEAFLAMKAIITTDALLHYPDHNLPFDVETDASDLQISAIIKQDLLLIILANFFQLNATTLLLKSNF